MAKSVKKPQFATFEERIEATIDVLEVSHSKESRQKGRARSLALSTMTISVKQFEMLLNRMTSRTMKRSINTTSRRSSPPPLSIVPKAKMRHPTLLAAMKMILPMWKRRIRRKNYPDLSKLRTICTDPTKLLLAL